MRPRRHLENAIEHGRRGGTITVTTDGTAADRVVLAVSNEGDPIPSDAAESIFDPLMRAAGSAQPRRAGAGLGLGLFIARQIAAAHGGTLTVDSDEQLATFTASLPRVAASESASASGDAAS